MKREAERTAVAVPRVEPDAIEMLGDVVDLSQPTEPEVLERTEVQVCSCGSRRQSVCFPVAVETTLVTRRAL